MHKTHIFDQKNNAKKKPLPTYLPYFFRTVTGNKHFIFLGLIIKHSAWSWGKLPKYIGEGCHPHIFSFSIQLLTYFSIPIISVLIFESCIQLYLCFYGSKIPKIHPFFYLIIDIISFCTNIFDSILNFVSHYIFVAMILRFLKYKDNKSFCIIFEWKLAKNREKMMTEGSCQLINPFMTVATKTAWHYGAISQVKQF